jgi:hypothetical protein
MNNMLRTFWLATFICVLWLDALSQNIPNVKISPGMPNSGQDIYVEFQLLGTNSNSIAYIDFITWFDSKGNGELLAADQKHTYFTVADNSSKDIDPSKNGFKIKVYKVPTGGAPLKYTAIVKVGNASRSTSIDIIPPAQVSNRRPASSFFTHVILQFNSLFNTLSLSLRGAGDSSNIKPQLQNVMRYNLKTDKAETLAVVSFGQVSSPQSSPASTLIAFVWHKPGISVVECITPGNSDKMQALDSGINVTSLCWSTQSRSLFYTKDRKLFLINMETHHHGEISGLPDMDELIYCYPTSDGTDGLVYRAQDPNVLGKFELFKVSIDKNLTLHNNVMMAANPALYHLSALCPTDNLLLSTIPLENDGGRGYFKIHLYEPKANGKMNDQLLFNDSFLYNDASWSKDGKYIFFTTNRH